MSPSWEVREGNCIDLMRAMPTGSVDAVVCDPPYGIGFMGHEWDHPGEHGPISAGRRWLQCQLWRPAPSSDGGRTLRPLAGGERSLSGLVPYLGDRGAARLKPGGHLVASGGTRTSHRLVAGIEDAGFEIRDSLMWIYGSGFPKSLDVSKAIDKAAGAERDDLGPGEWAHVKAGGTWHGEVYGNEPSHGDGPRRTAPATAEANKRWQGFGTALKPAHEPICLARKPLSGTVAQTVLEHGTGALNIYGCRIDHVTVNGGNLAENPPAGLDQEHRLGLRCGRSPCPERGWPLAGKRSADARGLRGRMRRGLPSSRA